MIKISPFDFLFGNLSLITAVAFLFGISISVYMAKIPIIILCLYFGTSIVTFVAYALDKSAAKKGNWRTKESTLHLFSLAGGWPGAIIAQKIFHHKTIKRSFRFAFWITVILNCGGLSLYLAPKGIGPISALFK